MFKSHKPSHMAHAVETVESVCEEQQSRKDFERLSREAEEFTKQQELCYATAIDFGDEGKPPNITETNVCEPWAVAEHNVKPFLRVILVDRLKQHQREDIRWLPYDLNGRRKISLLGHVFEVRARLLAPHMRSREVGHYPWPSEDILLMTNDWCTVTACEATSITDDGCRHSKIQPTCAFFQQCTKNAQSL